MRKSLLVDMLLMYIVAVLPTAGVVENRLGPIRLRARFAKVPSGALMSHPRPRRGRPRRGAVFDDKRPSVRNSSPRALPLRHTRPISRKALGTSGQVRTRVLPSSAEPSAMAGR